MFPFLTDFVVLILWNQYDPVLWGTTIFAGVPQMSIMPSLSITPNTDLPLIFCSAFSPSAAVLPVPSPVCCMAYTQAAHATCGHACFMLATTNLVDQIWDWNFLNYSSTPNTVIVSGFMFNFFCMKLVLVKIALV